MAAAPARVVVVLAAALCALPGLALGASTCSPPADVSRLQPEAWGVDANNTRFQPASDINAGNVGSLRLRFAFALADDAPHSWPLLSPDSLFIGDAETLVALDRHSGCTRWTFKADASIRTAIVHGRVDIGGSPTSLLFFGTREGSAYAIRATDGHLIWRVDADSHAHAMVTGTPTFNAGRLHVPVSSYELVVAAAPFYDCCTFRGSLLTVDAATGRELWRAWTIAEPAREIETRLLVGDRHGPSGAPVWSAPTIDAERGAVYFGTGENYSDPATPTSDAIIAVDAATGAVRWQRQFTAGDTFNVACELPIVGANCPAQAGPDHDFGAPPILLRRRGGDRILAGQKSGGVFALAPTDGRLLWQRQLGRGGKLGGIHWGMAASPRRDHLYVPVSDRTSGDAGTAAPGLYALAIESGAIVWQWRPDANACADKDDCHAGVSAAVLATDDLVFAGGLDGVIRAHAADGGRILWQNDTWRAFSAINGEAGGGRNAEGGAIDVHGPMLVGNTLIVVSGYRSFGQRGGNVLLVYETPVPASMGPAP